KGGAKCLTHDLWEETGRQIQTYLSSISLDDVIHGRLRPGAAAQSPVVQDAVVQSVVAQGVAGPMTVVAA
ncbi:MAG: hypothetical protein P4L64_06395, partial [Caulobacteraceae bacterium]|nr:hypothetical protein [Caulobacteraceae bacterium]